MTAFVAFHQQTFGDGSFEVATGLKKQILQKAIDNRQNITMPDCALKPKRVMEMLKALQEAVS